jgi:hypothetical protein
MRLNTKAIQTEFCNSIEGHNNNNNNNNNNNTTTTTRMIFTLYIPV